MTRIIIEERGEYFVKTRDENGSTVNIEKCRSKEEAEKLVGVLDSLTPTQDEKPKATRGRKKKD